MTDLSSPSPSPSRSFPVMYSPFWYFLFRQRDRFLCLRASPSVLGAGLALPWAAFSGRGLLRGLPLGRRAGWRGGAVGGWGRFGGGGGAKPQSSSQVSSPLRRPLLSLGVELSEHAGCLLGLPGLLKETGVSEHWGLGRGLLPLPVKPTSKPTPKQRGQRNHNKGFLIRSLADVVCDVLIYQKR